MPASDLYDAANELLVACQTVLATTAAGSPDRAYVSPGVPAFECDQLTVHAPLLGEEFTSPLNPAAASGHRDRYQRVNLATLVVTLVRCAPTSQDGGKAAETPDLDALAVTLLTDGWALWNGIMQLIREGVLFSACREKHFDSAAALPLQGNVGGWTLTFRIHIPGFTF